MTKENRIRFLLYSNAGKIITGIAQFLAPAAGFAVALFLAWNIETRFFPVVTTWTVNKITESDGHLILSGTVRKERACDLISTSVMAVPKNPIAPRVLIHQIRPDDLLGGNVPVGLSTWGPWAVKVPAALKLHRSSIDHLEVVGQHRCHALWNQQTVYGRVPIDQIP